MASSGNRTASGKKTGGAVYPVSTRLERQQPKKKKAGEQGQQFQDYSLIFIILFLVAFGLIMLYSTSSYEANITYGDPAYYLKRQVINSAAGLLVMALVALIPYRFWQKMSIPLYILSILMILMIIPFGREVNGAKRWIYIGPVSVQPAEISKIAVILLTASILTKINRKSLRKFWGPVVVMIPAVIQAALIYVITSNLSSALIVFAISFCMLFVVCRDYWRFFLLFGAGVGAAGFWVYHAVNSEGSDMGFRSTRLLAWLDPQKYADGVGFQTLQALYGIGSGGITGKGLGQSMQKLGYIPEAQNDMIFSIICEELGMCGALAIIAMFILLCWRLMIVATNARDMFGALTATGVMIHIAVQVILNIAVVTNTIPNTGVTLPFISYGGSSIVIMLAEIGIVLNIARSIRLKDL